MTQLSRPDGHLNKEAGIRILHMAIVSANTSVHLAIASVLEFSCCHAGLVHYIVPEFALSTKMFRDLITKHWSLETFILYSINCGCDCILLNFKATVLHMIDIIESLIMQQM